MKETLKRNNYTSEQPRASLNEDVWWSEKIKKLPSELQAYNFSAELSCIDHFVPTGGHKLFAYGCLIKMGEAFRLLQGYGNCI